MASGYERSPDYSGAHLTWWGTLVLVLFICVLAGVLVYIRMI